MQTPSDHGSKENTSVESLQPEASTEQEDAAAFEKWINSPVSSGFPEDLYGRLKWAWFAACKYKTSACSLLQQGGKGEAATPTTKGLPNAETDNPLCHWLYDLITLYKTPEAVCFWLNTPHPQLGGVRPITAVLGVPNGNEKVAAIVDQLASGAYL